MPRSPDVEWRLCTLADPDEHVQWIASVLHTRFSGNVMDGRGCIPENDMAILAFEGLVRPVYVVVRWGTQDDVYIDESASSRHKLVLRQAANPDTTLTVIVRDHGEEGVAEFEVSRYGPLEDVGELPVVSFSGGVLRMQKDSMCVSCCVLFGPDTYAVYDPLRPATDRISGFGVLP